MSNRPQQLSLLLHISLPKFSGRNYNGDVLLKRLKNASRTNGTTQGEGQILNSTQNNSNNQYRYPKLISSEVNGLAESLIGGVLRAEGLGKYCDSEFVGYTTREMQEALDMTPEEMNIAAHNLIIKEHAVTLE